ncbi:HU family DNA-binding protein [Nocardioides daejeonensis]|uniref:HU family DNA-binding protein n=1 Tax=Nocardioides daejeonensis TaxID=1046556 RepID=UPI000D74EB93|nr:HU family DNA-binding protein [Nocardioides daejeonensis]
MNKRELIEAVSAGAGLERGVAAAALDAMVGAITGALVAGERVAIPGLGTFETRGRAARTGRNPQTGEPIEIPAGTAAAFRPGTALRQAVNA